MKRVPVKKGVEKRKSSREKAPTSKKQIKAANQEMCHSCAKDLRGSERVLFVEEEVGRIFCTEECIASFFSPDIKRLEKEYFKRLSSTDLRGVQREKLEHLRWVTLQEPEEVWQEKTLNGDHRYTLISEFQIDNKSVWCVCICLFLKGEPSFLYLSFPTRNGSMVDLYRRGERIPYQIVSQSSGQKKKRAENQAVAIDGLATAWTEEETLRARITQGRRPDDIPKSDFKEYQVCFEETLHDPDEVWCLTTNENELQLYHFIRSYPSERPNFWYIIVARETENEEEIEILDSSPTRDLDLVERYRSGERMMGAAEPLNASRTIH
jgi:hypothetical protein